MTELEKLVVTLELHIDNLRRGLAAAERMAAQAGETIASNLVDKLNAKLTRASDHLNRWGDNMMGIGSRMTGFLTVPIAAGLTGLLKLGASAETTASQFETLLGSADAATSLMGDLSNFTASTPFQEGDTNASARSLLAFGVAADGLLPALQAIGDISAGIGAPLGEIAEIYGKARVQGRLFMEDINQLTGRGIPILQELAKQFDVTESEVRDLVSSGQVGFGNLEQAFIDLTNEGGKFDGMMQNLSETTGGRWSTMTDSLKQSGKEMGTMLLEVFNVPENLEILTKKIEILTEKITTFAQSNPQGFKFAVVLAGVIAAIGPVLVGIGGLVKMFALASSGMAMITTAGTALGGILAGISWPILLLVGAVALLAAAWVNNWGGIQEKTAQAWEAMRPALSAISDVIMTGLGVAVEWLKTTFMAAWERLSDYWTGALWPAISSAIESAWPVILNALETTSAYITDTLIPAGKELWQKWVTVWWPAIKDAIATAWESMQPFFDWVAEAFKSLVNRGVYLYRQWVNVWWPAITQSLKNAWTIIETVFTELKRWLSENIMPILEYLHAQWVNVWWPAIQAALSAAWEMIQPILQSLWSWIAEKITPIMETARAVFVAAWDAIKSAISTAWDAIKPIFDRIKDFGAWLSSADFSFNFSIPDLPDWLLPGSPIPLHTRWKDFHKFVSSASFAPDFGTMPNPLMSMGSLTGGLATASNQGLATGDAFSDNSVTNNYIKSNSPRGVAAEIENTRRERMNQRARR